MRWLCLVLVLACTAAQGREGSDPPVPASQETAKVTSAASQVSTTTTTTTTTTTQASTAASPVQEVKPITPGDSTLNSISSAIASNLPSNDQVSVNTTTTATPGLINRVYNAIQSVFPVFNITTITTTTTPTPPQSSGETVSSNPSFLYRIMKPLETFFPIRVIDQNIVHRVQVDGEDVYMLSGENRLRKKRNAQDPSGQPQQGLEDVPYDLVSDNPSWFYRILKPLEYVFPVRVIDRNLVTRSTIDGQDVMIVVNEKSQS